MWLYIYYLCIGKIELGCANRRCDIQEYPRGVEHGGCVEFAVQRGYAVQEREAHRHRPCVRGAGETGHGPLFTCYWLLLWQACTWWMCVDFCEFFSCINLQFVFVLNWIISSISIKYLKLHIIRILTWRYEKLITSQLMFIWGTIVWSYIL